MTIAIKYFLWMTLVLGVAYPLLITGIAKTFFPYQAGGSLVEKDGRIIGSALLSQAFKNPRYFWPRPSAVEHNPSSSGASNLGPTSADLQAKMKEREAWGGTRDLLYASGSGLDPHISPECAKAQIDRIAKARHFTEFQHQAIVQLLESNTEKRQWSFLGEPRINVLQVNLALDKL